MPRSTCTLIAKVYINPDNVCHFLKFEEFVWNNFEESFIWLYSWFEIEIMGYAAA